jgi:hypothetical protein
MKRIRIIAGSIVLACAAGTASAQPGGPYVGVSVGDASDVGTAVKLYGGAPVSNVWGWEAQYTDFGSVTEPTPFGSAKASAYALGLSLMGYLPMQSNLSAFGKIGVHYVKAKARLAGVSASDTSTEAGVGVGLLWQVNPQWGLRAEFENIGGSGGNVLTVGAQLRF